MWGPVNVTILKANVKAHEGSNFEIENIILP